MAQEAYLTVGQLAKRMNTTVRTLRYYHQVGLLNPAGTSPAGTRLYSDADTVRLGQIQALKSLGFSLEEIGTHLEELRTPEQVLVALNRQAHAIRTQIAHLRSMLDAVVGLAAETRAMNQVDFAKYAAIVEGLQEQQQQWAYRLFGERTRARVLVLDDKTQSQISDGLDALMLKVSELAATGAQPEDSQVQELVSEWWDLVWEFAGGDPAVLTELNQFESDQSAWPEHFRDLWRSAKPLFVAATVHFFEQHSAGMDSKDGWGAVRHLIGRRETRSASGPPCPSHPSGCSHRP